MRYDDTTSPYPDGGRPAMRFLFCSLALHLLLCPISAFGSSASWAVPEAILKFTIQTDPNDPQVPKRLLSELKARKGPSALRSPQDGGRWSGTYFSITRFLCA